MKKQSSKKKSKKKQNNSLNFLVKLKYTKMAKSLKRIRGPSCCYNFPRLSFSAVSASRGMRVFSHYIESFRRVIKRTTRKKGNLFIKVFPNYAITKKKDCRMGKGKGIPKLSSYCVKKYKVIFELNSFKHFGLSALFFKAFKKTARNFSYKLRLW